MKVLLINPESKFINSHRLYRHFLPPVAPLGLAYIAALLEANKIDVELVDMFADNVTEKEVLKKIKNTNPEIIGFSLLTAVVNEVRDLVKKIREANSKSRIVLGNSHASYFADQLLKEGIADIVVRGEGEIPMAELCKVLSDGGNLVRVKGISYSLDGKVFHNSEENVVEALDDLPFPAFHLLNLGRYKQFPMLSIYNRRFLPISASRGCPYHCYFCSQDTINKRARYRDIKRVVDEIAYMQSRFNIGYFCFTDAYFPFSESKGLEFCDQIMKRNLHRKIRWITESRVDKVNKKLLKKMKQAGLHLIMYGIEVGNQKVLDRMHKEHTLGQSRQALKDTRKAGILSLGLYMLGLPGETKQTCRETIEFAKELDADIAKFNIAIPFPGSQFFEDCMKGKRIEDPEKFTSWYNVFSLNSEELTLCHNRLNYKELVNLQRKAMIAYYFRPRIVLRFFFKKIVTFRNLLYGAYWLFSMFLSNLLERIVSFLKK